MTISTGERLPDANVRVVGEDGPADMPVSDLAAGKTIVFVGVPGAFTPTCSGNHLPGFIDNRDAILAKGVDEIHIVSVNDHHVMKAWAKASGGIGKLGFIADWDASFSKALGLDIDLGKAGLGVRSRRYAMIVRDGVVSSVDVEDAPGVSVSGAAAILEKL